uniref:Uncharacterized protein n=1 Tax=Panagrolaimus sp. PS1159 TaxID=55785 RepID=A0AC35F8C5_9BILA
MLLIILLTISAVSCLPVRESLCQRDDEFACNNGTCISAEWICDNVPDCLTGE